MRIRQAYISASIRKFSVNYLRKFNLVEGHNPAEPIVIFGLYGPEDYRQLLLHKNKVVVLWCGTDTAMLDPEKIRILKMRPAKHVVKSKFCSDDLKRHGIANQILPVSWQPADLDPVPRGEHIYFYGHGNAYGEKYLDEIIRRTGLEVIMAVANTYSKIELIEIYKKCFLGLRLTKHDGLPNTVLELGMMGRRCIYNGGIPGSIPWVGIDDICNNVKLEYNRKDIDDTEEVSGKIKQFIDVKDDWLCV